ncbi:MAG: hypothetical protein JXQ90_03030 [Cyclobacteriaceae bacterium]
MSTTKILTAVFFIVAMFLAWYLYDSINSTIEETKRIERMEDDIIDQLKVIREAQLAFKGVNGSYTSDWDKLINFVDSGNIYIVQRTETIITLAYGADSTSVTVDTLGSISVMDSVFNERKFPNFSLESMAYVPGVEPATKFKMWADKIQKGNILVDVVEVWNPTPVDKTRDAESELNSRKPLRFGSRTSVTTAGNWE